MYRVRNPIEALPGLDGLAKGHSPRVQEEPQWGSFPTLRTFSNLKILQKCKVPKKPGTLHFCKISLNWEGEILPEEALSNTKTKFEKFFGL
jgi:hypothetical protein